MKKTIHFEDINTFFNKQIDKEKIVRSDDYLNWIVDFTNEQKEWSDYIYLNDKKNKNYYYTTLLWHFGSFLDELANQQNYFDDVYYSYSDIETIYHFKLRNNYYSLVRFYSQECLAFISKEEFDNTKRYILIDEVFTDELERENELIQYIVINKDLIDKISPSKIGVHIGHACTLCAIKEGNTEKFKKWYQDGKFQKKIVLTAPLSKLEQLEKDFYAVRDLGLTEVEPDTLIAVSLGIKTRQEAKPFIKRFQLWK